MSDLSHFNGGLHLPGNKDLSNQSTIQTAPLPPYLILPLLQHIGEPTEPVVKVGERVLAGQIIAHCRSQNCALHISSPVHAPTSGTVVAIERHSVPHPSGLTAPCIILETDGEHEWTSTLTAIPNYGQLERAEVRAHIAKAGIVGLGGAGFPAHLKLKPEGIETLIINGAECEPYITCDDRLMREKTHDIIAGTEILQYVLGGAKRCLIAVEDNKPEAFQALSEAVRLHNEMARMDNFHPIIRVVKVPTLYPTGGERQLIKILLDKEVGRGKLPANVGIVVHNVETTRAIYRAVKEGRPLISRVVTMTGNGIAQPQNIEVLLGTPIHHLIDYCGRQPDIQRVIMGGPMMGFALPHDEMPVVKTTNCLIVSAPQEFLNPPLPMPCIRCGQCAEVCPINLLPQQLYWYAKAKDFKNTQAHHVFDCIDCGCCAYVCPSHIPLVSYFRYAKAEIRAAERERKKTEIARQRHEFRSFRLKREKAEKAAKHKQKAAEIQKNVDKEQKVSNG